MKLPTRVRAHEYHPDGVYDILFGGQTMIWCVANGPVIPGLPFLANTDHLYSNPNNPPVTAVASGADVLTVQRSADAGSLPTVGALVHQAYQFEFTSPKQVAPSEFQQYAQALGTHQAEIAFVASAEEHCYLDNGHSISTLAMMVLPGNPQTGSSFRVAFVIPGNPANPVSFGDGILGVDFARVAPNDSNHPINWSPQNPFAGAPACAFVAG